MRLGVGTSGVALDFDPTSFLVVQNNGGLGIGGILNGFELLRVTADGRVGIGISSTSQQVACEWRCDSHGRCSADWRRLRGAFAGYFCSAQLRS